MNEIRPASGQILGQYVSRHLIRRGKRTEVYCARHPNLEGDVAIKVFRPTFPPETITARFMQEVQAIADLKHPNIIRIHDRGIDRDACFVVMEFVKGSGLRDIISAHPTGLDRLDTLRIFSQIASAVAYAHERGVVHGNIKPDNVLLDRNNRPVLTDFVIPCLVEDDPLKPGTLSYLAPEQFSRRAFTPQSDIYALGVMLYEMVTGDVPFKGNSRESIEAQHRESAPIPPGKIVIGLDPRLEHVILKALNKRPADRYASARAMLGDLERQETSSPYETLALNRETAQQARKRRSEVMRFQKSRVDAPADTPAPAPPFWRRHTTLITVGSGFLVVLLIALIALLLTALL